MRSENAPVHHHLLQFASQLLAVPLAEIVCGSVSLRFPSGPRTDTTSASVVMMRELARQAAKRGRFHVYFVGGATAVDAGFRESTIDAGLCSDIEAMFREIQTVKEGLGLNIEFARPEDFVPPLEGTDGATSSFRRSTA